MVIDGYCKILLEIFAKMVYWERCFLETEVPVAQLDRVSASDAEGRGFESLRVRQWQTAWKGGFCLPEGRTQGSFSGI